MMLVEGISTSSRLQEDLDNLEVAVPAAKTARIPQKSNQNVYRCECSEVKIALLPFVEAMTTIYVKKDEEKVYNALLLDSLTVHDLKLGVRWVLRGGTGIAPKVITLIWIN